MIKIPYIAKTWLNRKIIQQNKSYQPGPPIMMSPLPDEESDVESTVDTLTVGDPGE